MAFDHLPTLAEVRATRSRACPKAGLPTVLARKARQESKADRGKAFRDAVWKRDKGRSRATGKKLTRVDSRTPGASLLPWSDVGEVDHAYPRSTAPERVYDVQNGILLSKEENRLRKVACAKAPEFRRFSYTWPEDRGKPQVFIWRDETGTITKETRG